MFVYKVSTSSEFICASYDHIYVPIIIYCLRAFVVVQTCNFVVMFMLMNNVCVQSFNFIQASMCKL